MGMRQMIADFNMFSKAPVFLTAPRAGVRKLKRLSSG